MRAIEIDPKAVVIGKRYRTDNELDEEFLESIKEKGILQPITVTPDFTLIAGGRRLAAALTLNLSSINAVIREVTGELDLRECELIENAHRKDLKWIDRTRLVNDIHALMLEKHGEKWNQTKTADFLNRSVGGITRQLQLGKALGQFPTLATCRTEDEAVKLYRKLGEAALIQHLVRGASAANTKQGTVQQPGEPPRDDERESGSSGELAIGVRLSKCAVNHYRTGDAFVGMQEIIDAKLTPNIKLVEVDPPYGIDLKDVKKGESAGLGVYNEIPKDDYIQFLSTLCFYLGKLTPPETRVIFWFGQEWYSEVLRSLRESGFQVDPIPCLWVKPSGQTASPDTYLARCYETFFVAWKGKPPIRKRGRSNVFAFNAVAAAKKRHPTERPIELMQEILTTFGFPGSVLMVPFCGSGNTLRAAYTCGMIPFGWDLTKEYKDPFLAQVELDMQNGLYDRVIGDDLEQD